MTLDMLIGGLITKSEMNVRQHWRRRAARAALQRRVANGHALFHLGGARLPTDFKAHTVTLTRVAPRTLDDDNLRSALKAVRDGVADALGCDDSARAGITWEYSQRKDAKPRTYAVGIAIEIGVADA